MQEINLLDLKIGQKGQVTNILGGENVKRKLYRLGIRQGVFLQRIQAVTGPVIVKLGNSQICIGRGVAEKIIVKQVD